MSDREEISQRIHQRPPDHIVRNVYTYQLNPEKLEQLISMLRETLSRAERELLAFEKFLQSTE